MKHRIAFVTHFCPHYRRRLFEEIAGRMESDFFFFAENRLPHHWNRRIPITSDGGFRRVELAKLRLPAGQVVVPGLAWTLTRRRYDAVVKCLNGKLMVPFVVALCRLRGLPLVIWTGMWYHPTTRFHRYTRRLTEIAYREAGAIVVYGEHVKRALVEAHGVAAEKIFVAGQAVEPERFEAVRGLPRTADAVVLYVGQFEHRKGIFDLLDAFGQLPNPCARLRLIGNGSLEHELRARAAVDPRVEVAGYVAQEDLPLQLGRARCLVLPSVTTKLAREPWGLVVNEAMHAGVPVVTTDAVGAAAGGLVRDGENGLVVPERSPDALARALGQLLDDPALAERLGQQAGKDVARFTHGAMADAFRDAVEYAIQARRAGD